MATKKPTKATTNISTEPVTTAVDFQAALDDVQLLLFKDRQRAHATLFGGEQRKSNKTPLFHAEMIDDFHDLSEAMRFVCDIAFRGAAKTTLSEEGVCIKAVFREFRHCLLLSSTADIAAMRLHAIKRQFERNESIIEIFGNLVSRPWGDDYIELANGLVIQAKGRGQAIRGIKEEDIRPDLIIPDDIEDWRSVASATQLDKTRSWFESEVIASGDMPNLRVRMYANDMGPDCLANKLKLPNSGWTVKVYPWLVKDAKGKEQSIWEDRYPLKVCLAKRAEMYERGSGDDYEREFMCSSARPESRIFRDEMQKVDARVRVYEPVNVMIVPEPMHSGTQIAACAGAAWSWVKDKLIVWELWSRRLAASEIVVEAQRMDALYRPVNIGVLHQPWHDWLHASLSLPNIVPLRPLANDLDFIRALQPFLANKQVIFAEDVAQAWSQFLAFPNGQIEAPRALAFALHPAMRQAQPMYGDFDTSNILPDMAMESGPATLVISASDRLVAGALCQAGGRGLRIFADWMEEGDPSEIAPRILQSANLTALRHCNIIMPARCFERGKDRLAAALRRMGIQASAGADEAIGRDELRRMLREQARGLPRLMVWDTARWTLSAFLAGYQTDTDEGPYKLAMEGVEALASLMAIGGLDDDARTNATARDGRAYFSARPVERVR